MVSFGAEDEQAQLQKVLSVLLSPEFEPVFRLRLMGGGSYAAARSQTVEDLAGEETAAVLTRPNNILGIEYLKAAHRLGFSPQWAAIPRKGAGHDQHGEEKGLMSASYVRHLLEAEIGLKPRKVCRRFACLFINRHLCLAWLLCGWVIWNGICWLFCEPARWIGSKTCRMSVKDWKTACMREYGKRVPLWNCISWFKPSDIPRAGQEEWQLHGFLGVTASMQKIRPPYLRILGIGFGGEEILRQMKKTAVIPFSRRWHGCRKNRKTQNGLRSWKRQATAPYVLGRPKPLSCGWEFYCPSR